MNKINFNWKPILAAFVAAGAVNLVGVVFFFEPIARTDTVGGPLVHPALGFFIYVMLSVALFDWGSRQIGNAYKAAFIIGASQFILVNVDYVLTGKRGLMTGAASTLLMLLTWGCVAFAYSYFISREKDKT